MSRYLNGVWRHFKRNKVFTLVNTIGLTVGITCSLVMFVMVKFELGFDKHHEHYDEIYRVRTEAINNGNLVNRIGVPKPLSGAMRADLAGVAEVAFISTGHFAQMAVEEGQEARRDFNEYNGLVYTEPSFFRIFDWKWISGEAQLLAEPNTVVLDQTTAAKYFPDKEALGKFIKMNGSTDLKVVGIVEDVSRQSDLPFSFFISLETLRSTRADDFTQWYNTTSNDRCYVRLEKGQHFEAINEQLVPFVDKHLGESTELEFLLQPWSEVHFDTVHSNLNSRSVAWGLIYTLAAVSLLMILTACFNFINLSTAVALKRSREVGIRKVLGSSRRQLVWSFLYETLSITVVSLSLSLALAERLLPGMVSEFADVELTLNLWSDPVLMLYLATLVVFVTVLAGLYPAWIISAYKPASLMRGRAYGLGKSINLRRVLIIFQFSLSQVFIIGTLIVVWQMQYIKNADLGFEKDQLVTLNVPRGETNHADVWHSVLDANSGVISHSFAAASPFSGMTSSTDARYTDSVEHRFTVFLKPADGNYLETYQMELLAGEGLLDADKANRYVVNEAFLAKLGVKRPQDAVGKLISVGGGDPAEISGVVRNFHMQTMKSEVKPAVMFNQPSRYWNLGIKLEGENSSETLAKIEQTWKELYPEQPFQATFMDEYIGWYYKKENRFFKMLVTFAIIAVVISCLGLYGMISFIANQRAKEIGIRKVLGASVVRILSLFSVEFTRLVLIAFILAAPLAYLGLQGWLDDFAYRIEVGPAIFAVGILVSLVITLSTIGYRSVRAGMANPVDSLRDE